MKSIIITGLMSAGILLGGCTMEKKLTYKGENVSGDAFLVRNKENKQAQLVVQKSGEWELFRSINDNEVDTSKPVVSGNRIGEYPLSYTDTSFQLYLFKKENGQMVISERHLPIQGSFNFRDLGGFPTRDGKFTRWGVVFRSDDLPHLTESDISYLNSIPLRTIVDFRSESEIAASPDKIPSDETQYVALSISPGNLTISPGFDLNRLTEERGDSLMRAVNYQLATDPVSIDQYQRFFRLLHNKENTPLVFHCTAGKDRTGFGAYLFLSALGVEEDLIMQDYLASNYYLQEKYGPYVEQYPALKPLLEVREDYLLTAINQIKNAYGSVDEYLDKVLNVNRKELKELYLY